MQRGRFFEPAGLVFKRFQLSPLIKIPNFASPGRLRRIFIQISPAALLPSQIAPKIFFRLRRALFPSPAALIYRAGEIWMTGCK